jgi:hypothetical protein
MEDIESPDPLASRTRRLGCAGKTRRPNSLSEGGLSNTEWPAEFGKRCMSLFLLAAAPTHLRGRIKLLTEMVENTPERLTSENASPSPLKEVLGEMVGRLLAFHSFDPKFDKRARAHKFLKPKAIGRKIRKLVAQCLMKWKSVKPINPSNVHSARRRVEQVMVDMNCLTPLLHYTGTPDRVDSSQRDVEWSMLGPRVKATDFSDGTPPWEPEHSSDESPEDAAAKHADSDKSDSPSGRNNTAEAASTNRGRIPWSMVLRSAT